MRSLFALMVCAAMTVSAAHAQQAAAPPPPPPVPDGVRYVVVYLEAMPTATAEGARLVRAFRDATRKEAGNQRAEALQRIGQAHHFVLLETWKDQAAADAHAKAPATAEFRDKFKAIQIAPIDERTHFPLSVGPLEAKPAGSAVAAVTHVDVIPPQRENGTAITKKLAEDGRKADGNLRFEAVTQTNRQNHFTVIELWRDRKAADAHAMAAYTKAVRDKLGPASGALYDERLYRVMN
jgi:quinol monooxygenase YgiN